MCRKNKKKTISGYRDSSKKFAAALRIEEDEELSEEDDDAETRLELANLVIEGKLTETINLTQLNYPGLLEKDDEINFTLKLGLGKKNLF